MQLINKQQGRGERVRALAASRQAKHLIEDAKLMMCKGFEFETSEEGE